MARISERELVIPALKAAAASQGGEIKTSDLIDELTEYFSPDGIDAELLEGRKDTHFSQKVRNLVSHRNNLRSMFAKGYATYSQDRESITITDVGRAFLDQVPEE